ncbi:hypothetical protein L226DRAFT_467312, partial [Lentinus tigrinus ALCF2SS1-7]|uniref:uncharacterized protein n=1 Tax=Lentinus tigrinus ALCF2SS1-7 TaxID=1328758 RepID=UPI001166218C
GGSVTDNPRLVQKAVKRVKEARIVFTTCSGAGLGILRNVDFDTVLIDEASQITEPCALIPLVKGCERAVLVGDHVQLRPTVKPMGKALEFDKSLFERLWRGKDYPRLARSMLEVQHQTRLRAASIAVLTPYSRQVQLLKQTIPGAMDVVVSTIDGFQGREGDIVVFSTVRCNAEGEIGFVEDERRLNVAWTRPKLGLIVVGEKRTLEATSSLWKKALAACTEVVIAKPDDA